ncbi:MAG: guanylate kinase [Nitrospirae bacterium]|nr:guanylate kinase [Nitrospirota bacterium]
MKKTKPRGNLFVVSAPSGAGKTTLCQRLTETLNGIRHSTSYTTRPPRKGEINDRDYTFVSKEEFKSMAKKGEFAEWARVHDSLYGTSRERLEAMLDEPVDVILDIDVKGASKIRNLYEDAVYIFVLPPTHRDLRRRLEQRMCNSSEEIQVRLKTALREIKEYKKYDYVIVNKVFDEALRQLQSIVISERLCSSNIDPSWVRRNLTIKEKG